MTTQSESCEEYTVNENGDECDKDSEVADSVVENGRHPEEPTSEVDEDDETMTNGNGNCSIETASNASIEDTVAKLEDALSRKFKLVTSRNNLGSPKKKIEHKIEPPGKKKQDL